VACPTFGKLPTNGIRQEEQQEQVRPKAEIRTPKEIRNPRAELKRHATPNRPNN